MVSPPMPRANHPHSSRAHPSRSCPSRRTRCSVVQPSSILPCSARHTEGVLEWLLSPSVVHSRRFGIPTRSVSPGDTRGFMGRSYGGACYGELRRIPLPRLYEKSSNSGEPPRHEANHRSVHQRFSARTKPLVVFAHPPLLVDPCQRPLHHPTARKYQIAFGRQ